jgi:carbon storage regulator CsrA
MIGENIRLEVLQVRGNQVRVGVVAPAAVLVDREEVFLRRARESGETVSEGSVRSGAGTP